MRTRLRFLCIALACAVHAVSTAHADKLRTPSPRIFAAPEGAVAFAMLPPPVDAKTGRALPGGRGIAYQLQADGSMKVLYRTTGWYSDDVFISPDGQSLVRLGSWTRAPSPSREHLGVAIYRSGKLVRQYAVTDLLKDASKARLTVSHYFWRPDEGGDGPRPELTDWDQSFTLQTVDGWEYVFDLKTGAIKRESRVDGGKN
ncbi:MAG: hypothetical protein JNK75_04210 [Betaproteobacteria bacterium]|nr:hypothetical protein [Betaproteobacteria bacterium]